jgi:hypothetical protein
VLVLMLDSTGYFCWRPKVRNALKCKTMAVECTNQPKAF